MSKLTVAPPNKESFGRRSADCAPVILRRPGTRSWSMSSSKYSAKQIRNARRRFKSQPEGFNCVIRGRCYMKPLLGSNPRIRKKRSQDSRILPFGEIEYLKRKMGFTLPSAESIVKSAKFTSQPKGKLSRQSAADRRLAEVLVDVEMTEMKKRSRLNSKKSNAYSSITTPRVYSTVVSSSNG
ncbi:hypothetical protein EGW08_013622 [Elysia chlorotica]|uniref:Uncharacterized protein n=1 Tax=Elysia chlorotica TaxID=188477 RepID=A0A3S0ZIK0_ELYCH|nr:hypothetical protein EGW08_013622 [Elysia chlorotica]